MKRFVLFSCLLGLSVEAIKVDPNLGQLLEIYQPYPHGLSSLQKPEVRGKLKKVENEKKPEETQIRSKVEPFNNKEDKKEVFDDKNGRGVYGQGLKDQKGRKNVRGVRLEDYKDGRRYEGRHREERKEGYRVEEIFDGKKYGGQYEFKDRRYKNEGYGGIGYDLEELSKDGRRYGAGYDYGLEYYFKNRRYNDGYGSGLVLDDSKDLYRRYKDERDRDYYEGYAGYGALPDYKDRKYKNEEYGEKFDGKGVGYEQKDKKNKNEGYGVGFVFEDPKKFELYKDGYVGIGYGNGEFDKINKGLIKIGYNDGFFNRGDDKYRDVFGLGYKDAYGYGIGYGEEGFDKIKNYRRFRDGYDLRLSPEGLDKLNEDNIFRYTYLKRINGETHYKTGLFYYPFDYQVIGRHGLGLDKRSAQSLGLAYPITPRELQPVGFYRFYKLEREPKNEYIAKYQKDIYNEGKAK